MIDNVTILMKITIPGLPLTVGPLLSSSSPAGPAPRQGKGSTDVASPAPGPRASPSPAGATSLRPAGGLRKTVLGGSVDRFST